MERFKIHEPCSRCVYVTVRTDSAFRTKTRVKFIVRDLEGVRGKLN